MMPFVLVKSVQMFAHAFDICRIVCVCVCISFTYVNIATLDLMIWYDYM